MSYRILLATASLGLAVALGGCGEDPGTRALSGGAIGAGGGAVLGAVTGLVVSSFDCLLTIWRHFVISYRMGSGDESPAGSRGRTPGLAF